MEIHVFFAFYNVIIETNLLNGCDLMNYFTQIEEASKFIVQKITLKPKIAIVLGSGLGNLIEDMTDIIEIPFSDIPHFEKPTAEGHIGKVVVGNLNNIPLLALSGRYHYYEGFDLKTVTLPIRVMKMLGIEKLILTNACGAINKDFKPGELMMINDHINTTFFNPLIGENVEELGPRFPDASNIYTQRFYEIAHQIAKKQKLILREGVYAWWTGPSYETPAEIKMLRTLGADAVGMSTVPEALVASHMQMEVLGISCLTNMASGILPQKLSHQEVLDVAKSVNEKFKSFIKEIISTI